MKVKLLFALSLFSFLSKAQVIVTVAGNGAMSYSGDGGPATAASMYWCQDVTLDTSDNIYIADYHNYAIRKVTKSTGIITTVAGDGTFGYSGDGGPATAAQITAHSVALDKQGNLYIGAGFNIRVVNATTGIISNFAGIGAVGFSGDGGPATAAKISDAQGMAFDAAGNLYFADAYKHVIRKINTSGIISTVAGDTTAGYSGDGGPATSAKLNQPFDVAFDNNGNLYVADYNNYVVRKVSPSGIITTFAGNGTLGNSGDGGPATAAAIGQVLSVATDANGNVYVATGYNVIRKINPAGTISTYAGNGTMGYTGDGGLAIAASLHNPCGLTMDKHGNLFFTDDGNNVVREISPCIPKTPDICMVEVDSLSQNNIIYWDKSLYPTADTFYIYRDTANNNYAPIGKVLASSLSMYIDTARSLYPANGDPNVTYWRYKISFGDTCGGNRTVSPLSPWHQSIYQYNIGGLFIWNHYQIEGQPTPVPGLSSYRLRRDNLANGNYITAATASASSTNINDPQYTTYQATADWRIETVWNINCTPTFRYANGVEATVVKSRSNVKNNRTTGKTNFHIGNAKVYPNPAHNIITVASDKTENAQLEIYNIMGEKILFEKLNNRTSRLDISSLPAGIYEVRISNNEITTYREKLVKE